MAIYLDYNATTPLDERVLQAMLPYFTEKFGNAASSTHGYGWAAEEAVKIAREKIAAGIGARYKEEIVFTSGSTEGLNLALKGIAERYAAKGDHIVTVATEHKAVLDACAWLEKVGKSVSYLGVDSEGLVDLDALREAVSEETVLVCVMLANNETGVIQPIKEIAEITHAKGSLLVCDATQAVGKILLDVNELGIDVMAFTGHKLYGPKGVGALFVRRRGPRVSIAAQIHGGGHERAMRSGTLNVPGIVGLSKALDLSLAEISSESKRVSDLRDRLENSLLEKLSGVKINGSVSHRNVNVTNLSFEGIDADALLTAIRELAVSTGSACTSAQLEPSHVLQAMGLENPDAYASIRFSLGRFTTEEEIDRAIEVVVKGVEELRARALG